MEEFFRTYGFWIVLAGLFVALHMFGMGCGGHSHGSHQGSDAPTQPGKDSNQPGRRRPASGCH